MPRIYAPNESHNIDWGFVDFVNGVAPMDVGESYAYFTDQGYSVDTNKDTLSIFDKMCRADLEEIGGYLKVSFTDETTKQTLVRDIETTLSTKYVSDLTVTSAAGTEIGDTKVTVTGEVGGTNQLMYKTAETTAPVALYMDRPDNEWIEIDDGDDVTIENDDDKITVVEINSEGFVISVGNDDITTRTE